MPAPQADRPRWYVHKKYSTVPIDIAVIEFDRNLIEGTIVKSLSSKSFLPQEKYALAPGEDLIVVGFPRGYSDEKHNLGLMLNALVSSAYGVILTAYRCS